MLSHNAVKPRIYSIPKSVQKIIITTPVLETFWANRQNDNASEGGGLLFAEFNLPIIRIVDASSPQATDKRFRTLFVPNRILQRKLIKEKFKQGYHFVGEWHTHPVDKPTPSTLDLESMADSFQKSKHELDYFIMIIVGNSKRDLELWVSLHNGLKHICLMEFNSRNKRVIGLNF